MSLGFEAAELVGSTESGEPTAVLALEDTRYFNFGGRQLTKAELERIHLEKYRLDALLASGRLPFDSVDRGPDPPDFVVTTENGQEGFECARKQGLSHRGARI